jgi:hypothetical protein
MRVIKLGAAACVGVIVVAAAPPVSAKPIEQEHYSFQDSDTFTDTECGEPITIDYAAEFSGLFKLKPGRHGDPTPYLFDNYSGVETYTNIANDETATIRHQGLFKDVHIEHVDGTVYRFTAIETGRPVVVFGPDGERLIFDRGRIRYTVLIDTQGDADLSNDVFIGDADAPDVAGPHPIFFEEAAFCDLLDVLR